MLHLMQPDDVNKAIGANVAALRAERGWSQAELAEHWGNALGHRIDPTTVTRLERGRRPTPVHELIQLAGILGARNWAALVQEPKVLRAASGIETCNDMVTEAYDQIRDATVEYLKAQYLLERAIARGEEVGVFDAAAHRIRLTFPPEEAVLMGRIRWQRRDQASKEGDADYKRIDEVIPELLAVLRDKGLVEDLDAGEASRGDDVEHQEAQ
jgi:transcriptional regulator with XRE-family HTH domain